MSEIQGLAVSLVYLFTPFAATRLMRRWSAFHWVTP